MATRERLSSIRGQLNEVEREFSKTISNMIVSAFALVAALAWNTAITKIIERYLQPGSSVFSWIIYALIVTTIAVLVTVYMGKLAKDKIEEQHNN